MRNRTALARLAFTLSFATTALAGGPQPVTPSGAVPIFVFAGQSNAVGVDTLDELSADQSGPQPNVLFYGPNETGNTWGVLTLPTIRRICSTVSTGRAAVLVRRSLRARPFPTRWVAHWWRK
jgi:hypothetical protein